MPDNKIIDNLRNRPKASEYSEIQADRGSGQLDSINAYLRNDPASYFYQKFNESKNPYLRNDFWSEAAKRGETDSLINILQASGNAGYKNKAFDAVSGYGDRMDYDTYMLAMQIPLLDNETKIDRMDEESGYEFGKYTDQEWANEILKHTIGRWDTELIEEYKANRGWLENLAVEAGVFAVSGLTNVVGGALQFFGDITNLGEGLLNMMFNWTNDGDVFDRFTYAFASDNDWNNPFGHMGEWLQAASYEYQRQYAGTVNAVAAHEEGYRYGEGSNFLEQIANSSGVGAGYTTYGRYFNGATQAIGYMIPTIILGKLTGGASAAGTAAGKAASVGSKIVAGLGKVRSGIFYAGIYSGMVKDTVTYQLEAGRSQGITYKDLNSGEIMFNSALKAGAQYAIEVALGAVLGFSFVDELTGIGSSAGRVGAAAAKGVVASAPRAAGQVLLAGAKAAGKEGLEETLQEMSDLIIDYGFGGGYRERVVQDFSIQNLTDAFIVGALTSVVMGSFNNVVVHGLDSNRGVGIDADGKTFTLGFFQSINLRQAMESMHEWNKTASDEKAPVEKRAAAMLSMNAAISTLGDVYRNMGTERAVKADAIIMDMLNMQNKTQQIAAFKTEAEYVDNLWTAFEVNSAAARQMHTAMKLEIKKAAIDKAVALKEAKVTKFDKPITAGTDPNDPALNIAAESAAKLKAMLSKLGTTALIGIDSDTVIKSGDIIFANLAMIENGDVENIIRGVSYDLVINTVKSKLTPAQQKLIIQEYSRILGVEGTIDKAIQALLFDKDFYLNTLLRMQERTRHQFGPDAYNTLAIIDQLLTASITPNITKGTITERAYKTLLEKVQNNMRSGLVTFATQYNKIDLGTISNSILPADLKAAITNHRNVAFTDMINAGLQSTTNTPPISERVAEYHASIDKYASYITQSELADLKAKAASADAQERRDAYIALIVLTKVYKKDVKLTYLTVPISDGGTRALENTIADFETYAAVSWQKWSDGKYEAHELSPEFTDFIQASGYATKTRAERMTVLREVVYRRSQKLFTVNENGHIVMVIDKFNFMKDRYLGAEGEANFRNDLRDGKVKTIDDIVGINVNDATGNMKIVLDPNRMPAGTNGEYREGSDTLYLSGTNLVDTLMHELTHYTQYVTKVDSDEADTDVVQVLGGTSDMFSVLPKEVRDGIVDYIKKHYPISYKLITGYGAATDVHAIYFMLEGELQANATIGSVVFEAGFRWQNNRTVLVSPDGKERWSMSIPVDKTTEAANKVTKAKTEDKTEAKAKSVSKTNSTFYEIAEALENLPGNMGVSPKQHTIKELVQIDEFYGKYPELREWVEGDVQKTPEVEAIMRKSKPAALKLLYSEMFGSEKGTYEEFLNTPIKFIRSMTTSIPNDVNLNSASLGYDYSKMPNFGNKGETIFFGEILPSQLVTYLPLSYAEGIIDAATLHSANQTSFEEFEKTISKPSPTKAATSRDQPITKSSLDVVAAEHKDWMKGAALKDAQGNPLVWYRGFNSVENMYGPSPVSFGTDATAQNVDYTNKLNKLEADRKAGKVTDAQYQDSLTNLRLSLQLARDTNWFTLDYGLAEHFAKDGDQENVRGFISNIKSGDLKTYDAVTLKFNNLRSILTESDIKLLDALLAFKIERTAPVGVYQELYDLDGAINYLTSNWNLEKVRATQLAAKVRGELIKGNFKASAITTDLVKMLANIQGYKGVLFLNLDENLHSKQISNVLALDADAPIKRVTVESATSGDEPLTKPAPLIYKDKKYEVKQMPNNKYMITKDIDEDYPRVQIVNRDTLKPDGEGKSILTDSERRNLMDYINGVKTPFPGYKKKKKADDEDTKFTPTSQWKGTRNYDQPLTFRATKALREDASTQTYMKDGFLKYDDNTPIVHYRGFAPWKLDSELHANEGQTKSYKKLGEFFTSSVGTAQAFAIGKGFRGFISNVTQADTKIYDFQSRPFHTAGALFTAEDTQIHKHLLPISKLYTSDEQLYRLKPNLRGWTFAQYMENSSKAEQWNQTISDLTNDFNIDRDLASLILSHITYAESFQKQIIDTLIPLNILQGYKAILAQRVDEGKVAGEESVVDDLIILYGTKVRRVTFDNKDINWSEMIKPHSVRYISNELAKKSNLKYFIKKGHMIQLAPNVASFVSHTTDDFSKLPKLLRDKILTGTLNYFDITSYVATARTMNDYTFQSIARYIYGNDALASITFREARNLIDDVTDLATISYVIDTSELVRTPMELNAVMKVTNKKADRDQELAKKMVTARKYADMVNVGQGFQEAIIDPKQMMPIMMRHYNGTFDGIRKINNLGKVLTAKQEAQTLIENVDTGVVESVSKTAYKWIDNIRKAEIDYESDSNLVEDLDSIDRFDKIKAIEDFITNAIIARVEKMPKAERLKQQESLLAELDTALEGLDSLSDVDLNKRYLAILANEVVNDGERNVAEIMKEVEAQPRTRKNVKDHIRQAGRTVTTRIAGLKRRYNMLPKAVQEAIDPKTYKLQASHYTNMTDAQLDTLLASLKEASSMLSTNIKASEIKHVAERKAQERLVRLAAKEMKPAAKSVTGKTLREKINIVHKTKVVNQKFTFDSRENVTTSARQLLNTQWAKQTKSKVKGLTTDKEQNVHNGQTFFEQNADVLMAMTMSEVSQTTRWFMDANVTGVPADGPEAQTFAAIKLYYLGYVFSQSKAGGLYASLDANLKQRIEKHLGAQVTVAGTALAVWNNLQGLINPIRAMKSANMEIAGVELSDEEKEMILDAAVTGDIPTIVKARQKIIERVNIEKTTKKNILRKITTVRSMSMLSNPVTWLRNIISNVMLKRLNKWSSKIGDRIASTKTAKGQFKMDGKITPQIQAFINEHFLDNKLFDTIVSNLSRYNPSDIQSRFKDATGLASKDAIFANMVIKSLYNEFYNQNMFNSQHMNKLHQFLMKMLSDNNYVREASIRYFGKIIAERGYDLTRYTAGSEVSDRVMNDFANAIGLGMADYMHSNNFLNSFESVLAEKSEAALFAYKLILPFGSASWNWFKAAMRYSPVGLGQSIVKLATLEQQIIKAETAWAKGEGQVAPELTEFLIRRDLGSGVIGTTSMILGMILAGLGYVELEEEDYGKPKLRIGNVRIDVSTIFGSSSLLAGMALVKGWDSDNYIAALDAALDPLVEGFFLVDILTMDQYNNAGWAAFGLNFMEQTLLSFIPNGVRWLSGATYTGTYRTNNMFERAVARIPFFGAAFGLEKKVNPYTGDMGDAWDIFNRVVPFLEVRNTSTLEETSKNYGINKTQLRGSYTINGEDFKLNNTQVAELNRAYGQWNADDLTNFYNNKSKHNVKMANGTYRVLTYNQMTDDQRKNAVTNIFNKNSEYAKIQAWLDAGYTYYASTADYAELRKMGVKGKLYKGSKGFSKN